jgi:hypothetical protein
MKFVEMDESDISETPGRECTQRAGLWVKLQKYEKCVAEAEGTTEAEDAQDYKNIEIIGPVLERRENDQIYTSGPCSVKFYNYIVGELSAEEKTWHGFYFALKEHAFCDFVGLTGKNLLFVGWTATMQTEDGWTYGYEMPPVTKEQLDQQGVRFKFDAEVVRLNEAMGFGDPAHLLSCHELTTFFNHCKVTDTSAFPPCIVRNPFVFRDRFEEDEYENESNGMRTPFGTPQGSQGSTPRRVLGEASPNATESPQNQTVNRTVNKTVRRAGEDNHGRYPRPPPPVTSIQTALAYLDYQRAGGPSYSPSANRTDGDSEEQASRTRIEEALNGDDEMHDAPPTTMEQFAQEVEEDLRCNPTAYMALMGEDQREPTDEDLAMEDAMDQQRPGRRNFQPADDLAMEDAMAEPTEDDEAMEAEMDELEQMHAMAAEAERQDAERIKEAKLQRLLDGINECQYCGDECSQQACRNCVERMLWQHRINPHQNIHPY